MNESTVALAVFVKTPGYSPVKTRLAASIGAQRAIEFYDKSVAAVEATVRQAARRRVLRPYWAVAESEAHADARWSSFPRVSQGAGSLPERLATVFSLLSSGHAGVIAISGDAPQIAVEDLVAAAAHLQSDSSHPAHALGRCPDGGFYLFGANYAPQKSAWMQASLGGAEAASSLVAALGQSETPALLEFPIRCDVDEEADLRALHSELDSRRGLTPEQVTLFSWLGKLA